MIVNHKRINKQTLSQFLCLQNEQAIVYALLNPKDPQDVPRAVQLILLIIDLRNLDQDLLQTPAEVASFNAILLLGKVLDGFLRPFIDPTMSLSAQIESFVTFAHLSASLYILNGTAFMSNQLYGDLQATVKNAIFRVAKAQILDSELEMHFSLLGDDTLETLFGRARMLGGHAPNCNLKELCDRLGRSMNLDRIYDRYPWLEVKESRLSLGRERNYDHVGPRTWKGDVQVKNCDLVSCWARGAAAADHILHEHHVQLLEPLSDILMRPHHDLMRPDGKRYPGISTEVDPSLNNLTDESAETSNSTPEDDVSAETTVKKFEDMLASKDNRLLAVFRSKYLTPSDLVSLPSDHKAELTSGKSVSREQQWMDVSGENIVHKSTILRELFDPTHDIDYGNSPDRLHRVRCYTIGGNKRTLHDGHVDADEPLFQQDSLFGALVGINNSEVAFAIMQCTDIKAQSSSSSSMVSMNAAPLSELSSTTSAAKYIVTGQPLSFRPVVSGTALAWVWDGQTLAFDSPSGSKTTPVLRDKELTVALPGQLLIPLTPDNGLQLVSADNLRQLDLPTFLSSTWLISESEVVALEECLRTRATANNAELLSRLPVFGQVLTPENACFPFAYYDCT